MSRPYVLIVTLTAHQAFVKGYKAGYQRGWFSRRRVGLKGQTAC